MKLCVFCVAMQAKTFVHYVLKTQIPNLPSLSCTTWQMPESSECSTAHPRTSLPSTRTSATFSDIQLQFQTAKPHPVLPALRRRMSTLGRRTNGLNTQSPVRGMGVARKQCGGYLHSCRSAPSLIAQVRFSICRFSVTTTNGCRQWNGPKLVAIIL